MIEALKKELGERNPIALMIAITAKFDEESI